jgi:hypothetical protein
MNVNPTRSWLLLLLEGRLALEVARIILTQAHRNLRLFLLDVLATSHS